MHELPITQNILEIALRHAAKAQASRITHIYLVIGQLASVVDDSVQFYWDQISLGSIAEGARLHFRRIPAELVCLECSRHFPIDGQDMRCPDCRSEKIRVAAGNEFSLEAIDVE